MQSIFRLAGLRVKPILFIFPFAVIWKLMISFTHLSNVSFYSFFCCTCLLLELHEVEVDVMYMEKLSPWVAFHFINFGYTIFFYIKAFKICANHCDKENLGFESICCFTNERYESKLHESAWLLFLKVFVNCFISSISSFGGFPDFESKLSFFLVFLNHHFKLYTNPCICICFMVGPKGPMCRCWKIIPYSINWN